MRKVIPKYFHMDKATFESVASRRSGRHANRTMEIIFRVVVNRENIEDVSSAIGVTNTFARHSVEAFCRTAQSLWPDLMIHDPRNMLITLEIPIDRRKHFEDMAKAARLVAGQGADSDDGGADAAGDATSPE